MPYVDYSLQNIGPVAVNSAAKNKASGPVVVNLAAKNKAITEIVKHPITETEIYHPPTHIASQSIQPQSSGTTQQPVGLIDGSNLFPPMDDEFLPQFGNAAVQFCSAVSTQLDCLDSETVNQHSLLEIGKRNPVVEDTNHGIIYRS